MRTRTSHRYATVAIATVAPTRSAPSRSYYGRTHELPRDLRRWVDRLLRTEMPVESMSLLIDLLIAGDLDQLRGFVRTWGIRS